MPVRRSWPSAAPAALARQNAKASHPQFPCPPRSTTPARASPGSRMWVAVTDGSESRCSALSALGPWSEAPTGRA
eukprot:10824028-Alexandrium_andersonii.AAC.1